MKIIDISNPSNHNKFRINRLIDAGEKYYAVIQPHITDYKIEIGRSDFEEVLKAYHSSKLINCYPLGGNLNENIFENPAYRIEIL